MRERSRENTQGTAGAFWKKGKQKQTNTKPLFAQETIATNQTLQIASAQQGKQSSEETFAKYTCDRGQVKYTKHSKY